MNLSKTLKNPYSLYGFLFVTSIYNYLMYSKINDIGKRAHISFLFFANCFALFSVATIYYLFYSDDSKSIITSIKSLYVGDYGSLLLFATCNILIALTSLMLVVNYSPTKYYISETIIHVLTGTMVIALTSGALTMNQMLGVAFIIGGGILFNYN